MILTFQKQAIEIYRYSCVREAGTLHFVLAFKFVYFAYLEALGYIKENFYIFNTGRKACKEF